MMENNKGKGIRQQIEDPLESYIDMSLKRSVVAGRLTEEDIVSFLEVLISNNEYPDDMEIFTTDRGWHKVKDYR